MEIDGIILMFKAYPVLATMYYTTVLLAIILAVLCIAHIAGGLMGRGK